MGEHVDSRINKMKAGMQCLCHTKSMKVHEACTWIAGSKRHEHGVIGV